MKTLLTYTHGRNLFTGTKFKSFVHKYFKDVKFVGFESGNWGPQISISNWEEVKDKLPKYAIPSSIELDKANISFLEALSNGQLGLAREKCGGNKNYCSKGQLKW